ncbi:MAG: type II toxin-antitoxin system RatA family toxin, partial [Pseudomonadota bacterium]
MPQHRQTQRLPHSPEQLYDLVVDVAKYPEFIPWCVAARVKSKTETTMVADLMVGFKVFRERYTSEIHMTPKSRVLVEQSAGPFKHLRNSWAFTPADDGGSTVDFFIDFEFSSALLQRAAQPVFSEATRRMVSAFEKRAQALYG